MGELQNFKLRGKFCYEGGGVEYSVLPTVFLIVSCCMFRDTLIITIMITIVTDNSDRLIVIMIADTIYDTWYNARNSARFKSDISLITTFFQLFIHFHTSSHSTPSSSSLSSTTMNSNQKQQSKTINNNQQQQVVYLDTIHK